MGGALQRGHDPRDHRSGMNPDPVHQLPGKGLMQQKFRLFGLLDVRGPKIPRRDAVPIDLIKLVEPGAEPGVNGPGIREGKGPAPAVRLGPGDDSAEIRLQMDDRLLATGSTRRRCLMPPMPMTVPSVRAAMTASDQRQPSRTIDARLSTCTMW